jgi:hypothetical protein
MLTRGVRLVVDKVFKVIHSLGMKHSISHKILWSFVMYLKILSEACFQDLPESAICVQRFDDSRSSAIRITYRISLRSSSLREPRYPLLRVVI